MYSLSKPEFLPIPRPQREAEVLRWMRKARCAVLVPLIDVRVGSDRRFRFPERTRLFRKLHG